jgi:flagellar motor protein MotB
LEKRNPARIGLKGVSVMTGIVGSARLIFGAGTMIRTVALVCVAAFLASLAGCVSLDQYDRMELAWKESQERLAAADNDLQKARDQMDVMKKQISALNDQLHSNDLGVDALRTDRATWEAKYAELQKKFDDLVKQAGSMPVLPVAINAALRDLAAQYPDYLVFDERLGMIQMKSDLTFDAGSTDVSPRGKQVLGLLAQILNKPEIAKQEIEVVGHTDDIPIRSGGQLAQRNPDNWTLSTNRAWSVLAVLRSAGLKADRGMACGWGDQRPVAPNAPGQGGNQANRRVEIFIRPTKVPEGITVSTPGARAAARPTTPASAAGGVPMPR